jgi:hypothetical protein
VSRLGCLEHTHTSAYRSICIRVLRVCWQSLHVRLFGACNTRGGGDNAFFVRLELKIVWRQSTMSFG